MQFVSPISLQKSLGRTYLIFSNISGQKYINFLIEGYEKEKKNNFHKKKQLLNGIPVKSI